MGRDVPTLDLPDWAREFVTGRPCGPAPTDPAAALTATWLHDTYVHRDRTIAQVAQIAAEQFALPVTEADVYAALDRHGITWRNGGAPTPGLTRAVLADRYLQQGWSLQAIADDLGVSREAVRKARDRFGLPRRPAGLAARLSRTELERLYVRDGLSVRQVADRVDASASAVSRLLAAYGIVRRPVQAAEATVDVAAVADRYRSGESIRSIAADVDRSDTTVRNLLLRHGVTLRGKRRLHEEVDDVTVKQWLHDGAGVRDIAGQLGCTAKSVYRLLERYGLQPPDPDA